MSGSEMACKIGSQLSLTVSIVAFKTDPRELEQVIGCCLSSRQVVEVIVADNSPHNELAPLCCELGVKYIHMERNVGFGTAHNIALKSTSASPYHLVLNPDVWFDGKVLDEL